MRSRSRTRNGMAKRDKRYTSLSQVLHQSLTFGTVGLHCNVYSIAMIESHLFVSGRLTKSADRQWSSKLLLEECLQFGSLADHPCAGAVVANQSGGRLVGYDLWRRQQQ